MAALSPASPLYRLREPGAYHLAIWSYSIYLTHKAVAHVLGKYLKSIDASASLTLVLISILCIFIGAIFYLLIERLFFALRDAKFPSLFKGPLPTTSAIKT